MINEVTYPADVKTTQEEREFDSFLLSYVSELAVKQRSPKVIINYKEVDKAWQVHNARNLVSH